MGVGIGVGIGVVVIIVIVVVVAETDLQRSIFFFAKRRRHTRVGATPSKQAKQSRAPN